MSKVRHEEIHQVLDVELTDQLFLEEMVSGLKNLIATSNDLGYHIDWSTLHIDGPERIEVSNAAGETLGVYSHGIVMKVDSIHIEEDE